MMASSTAPPSPSGINFTTGNSSYTSSLVTTTAPPSPIFTFQPSPSPISTTAFNIPAFGEYNRSSFGGFPASQRPPFTFPNPSPSSGFFVLNQ
ncbi:hypothetical protein Ddye_019390 [Dipteronia dyeriana]|uniref:Uncharacterized protein n=1 Tax=Dipteronia dyeriana TaxID=168575 RepID=A0AAD9TXU4_9ROSI|nr:hypothetical protein Ddye_019390 [Dipteronia dyeriana]